MKVDLDEREWNWLMNVLATKLTWAEANPMLMKIGDQLRRAEQSRNESIDPRVETMSEKRREEVIKEWEEKYKGNSGERPTDRGD
jgi:hypothetical protein